MEPSNVEFIIEGTHAKPLLTFKVAGRLFPPARKPLGVEPFIGSVEATIADYKDHFPEDTITLTDKREETLVAQA